MEITALLKPIRHQANHILCRKSQNTQNQHKTTITRNFNVRYRTKPVRFRLPFTKADCYLFYPFPSSEQDKFVHKKSRFRI